MTVKIPENYYVLTRDFDLNDSKLQELGLDGSAFADYMDRQNIYLNALGSDETEILFTMPQNTSGTLPDYSLMSDEKLLAITNDIVSEFENIGGYDVTVDVYHHPQTKFLQIHFTQLLNDIDTYNSEYFTVINNRQIVIVLKNYGQPVTDTQETLLRQVVDGVAFDAPLSFNNIQRNGLNLFGINVGQVLLYGLVGACSGGILIIIRAIGKKSRQRRATTAPHWSSAPPGQQNSLHNTIASPSEERSSTTYRGQHPVSRPVSANHEQALCPNCLAYNWRGDDRCASCGTPLN
ncbi:hypothetical protein AAFA46_09095 [Oscillospiraceae bacterium WX1]